jgi:hypothetical protein
MTVNTTQLSRLLPLALIAALSVGACGGPAATDAAPTNSTPASSGAVPAVVAPPAPATPAVLEYSQQEFCAKAPTLFRVVRNPSEADAMAKAIAATPSAIRPDIQLIIDFQQNRLAELRASQNGGPSKLTTTPAVVQAYRHYNEYCGLH